MTKIAMLTAGGLAPCLSSAVGGFIEGYSAIAPDAELVAYRYGYQGLLTGTIASTVTADIREKARISSIARAVQPDRQQPREAHQRRRSAPSAESIKAKARTRSRVAAALNRARTASPSCTRSAATTPTRRRPISPRYPRQRLGHHLTVVGLPKTIDNDVVPIRQSLGAITAAEQSAPIFFENVSQRADDGAAHARDP
jgi:pyrophosphate--fructose-6-phosphate 1-phosphotransferase